MSQITLYLDEATQELVERAAKSHGVSKSRWVADLIRKHADTEWPATVLDLAGKFADFPLRDSSAQPDVADVPRLGW